MGKMICGAIGWLCLIPYLMAMGFFIRSTMGDGFNFFLAAGASTALLLLGLNLLKKGYS